jgi:hypothetical protein
MQNAQQGNHHMHHIHTDSDTTRIVAVNQRHIALYHLKQFVKVSIVVAATIISLLYTAILMIGVPAINM